MERKAFELEIKSSQDREFSGHLAVFNNEDLGNDIIVPGAFKKSLETPGALRPMLWMHQPDKVIGKWLEFAEDAKGLFVRGVFAATDLGTEIYDLVKMGAVRGMSIGYKTVDYAYNKAGARMLKELQLFEGSIVSMAMNPLAEVEHVKSRVSASGEYVPTVREFERILRDVGCSKGIARKMIARIFDGDSFGEMPSEPAGGTPEIDGDLESAAKAVRATILSDATEREIVAAKLDGDSELADDLKSLQEELIALRFKRRFKL
jgi:HK97 family phage prohead protease